MCKKCDETSNNIKYLINEYQKEIKCQLGFMTTCKNEQDEAAYISRIDTLEEIIFDLSRVNSRINYK